MRPRHVLSLRHGIPLLLLALFGVLWGAMVWQTYYILHLQMEASSRDFLIQDMASLQFEMEREFTVGNFEDAGHDLMSKGVNGHYTALAALDAQGRILYATGSAWTGRQGAGAQVLPGFDAERFAKLQRTQRTDVRFSPSRQAITVYIPLRQARNNDGIRSSRSGALFARYELDAAHAEIWIRVWGIHGVTWLLLLAALLALQLFLQRFVNLPIKQLITQVHAVAGGKQGVRSNFTGQGEIARLGNALNKMSAQLEAQSEERSAAEAALVASEEKYRSICLAENAAMIVVANDQGNICDWNPAAEQAFGYSTAEALGSPLTLLMPERYHEQHRQGFDRAIAKGVLMHPKSKFELHGVRKNGQEFPIDLSFCCWRSGTKLYFSAVILDISERKQAELILRRGEKMAAIGQLSGGIALDFNNLLGIMLGNLNLLQPRVAQDGIASRWVAAIEKSVRRAADLTRRLLGFSSQQTARIVVTDIGAVLRQSQDFLARSLGAGVVMEMKMAENLWRAEINAGELEDALLILALNARDAMSGQGRLLIEAENIAVNVAQKAMHSEFGPGEYLRISVSDSGQGLGPDQLEHIFEPSFTTSVDGTGLGLARVFGFVKRSAGHIQVDTQVGAGATFRLYLSRSESRLESTSAEADIGMSPSSGQGIILVVDDEPDLLELAREAIAGLGYRVLVADNVRHALQRLREAPTVQLLFTDVVMKGAMDGYALARQASALQPGLKVLLTSGYRGSAAAQEGAAGVEYEFLAKPYTLDELAQRLRRLLPASPSSAVTPDAQQAKPPSSTAMSTEWEEVLATGSDVLDDEHRQLIELISNIHQALHSDVSTAMLDDLVAHSQSHHKREEALMTACAYPGLNNHRKVHQLLIRKITKMRVQQQRGLLSVADLSVFLHDWLHDHILIMDKAFMDYRAAKGRVMAYPLRQGGGDVETGELP